jgi:hypothetical protein
MSLTCSPRHLLDENFRCKTCGKTSQQCADDFEPREFDCGCCDLVFSKDAMGFIQCVEHAEQSMWEVN